MTLPPVPEPESAESETPEKRMLTWARNSTIWRIERRMLSEKQLSDAISRKAREKFPEITPAQLQAVAAWAVRFARDAGGIDDKVYAEVSTRAGVRNGKSKKAIAQKLSIRGIAGETAAQALEESDDLHAAIVFARKRAFGPFRREEPDEKRRTKELSAFARNGFSFSLGKRIYDMTREEAEDILYEKS